MTTKPRFTVGTVTGWPISGTSGATTGSRKASTIAYVYDSAYCYREMGEFTGQRWGTKKLEAAQALADKLNEADALGLLASKSDSKKGKPKGKRKRRLLKRRRAVGPGHFTEYQGYMLYVIPQFIFVYDTDKNLLATVTTMGAARRTISRLRREARAA